MIGAKTIVFLKELLSDRLRLPFDHVISPPDGQEVYKPRHQEESSRKMIIVKDVPDYFDFEISLLNTGFRSSEIRTLEAYYVGLNNFKDIGHYLVEKVSAKRRSNLRKYLSRLELSFDIRYTVYYGAIDQQEYHRLFKCLREFLVKRFAEKREVNYEIPYLQEMEEMVYDLILREKASLYVIYHQNQPVSIRINMFYQNLAYYIISGYDVDYSAFRLGSIDMVKNIEWCLEKSFTKYDLLKGYPEFKGQWATHRYYNYDQLIWRQGNILQFGKKILMISTGYLRYRFLELSRQFGIYHRLKKLKRNIYAMRFGTSFTNYQWAAAESNMTSDYSINVYEDPAHVNLRRPVNDFLFQYKERLEDVSVFAFKSQSNRYLIKGKSTSSVLLIK